MAEIRDPIYGFIMPSDIELKIINTAVFQRLRRIRQLAMAYLVYPSANHTRFEHSLGVFHIAGRLAEKLLPGPENKDNRDLVRLAALLHDVGHGPFSHSSEDILTKFGKLPEVALTNKIHEAITFAIIKDDPELKELLGNEQRERIVGLLSGKSVDQSLMRQIVSGPMDADKMDYLLRDSYYCGVKYGLFDLDRMLNIVTQVNEVQDRHLGIKADGINTLEQYFLAKYYMTTQVYSHKIRRVSDAMILRGIEMGIEKDNSQYLKDIFCYDPERGVGKPFLEAWDDKVVSQLMQPESSYAGKMFDRLYYRHLYKRVFSRKIAEIPFAKEEARDKLININNPQNEKERKRVEETIARDVLECAEEDVILKSTMTKSVKEMARDSESGIWVFDDDKQAKNSFEQQSTVFKAIDEQLKDIIVEVYSPAEYTDSRDKRKKEAAYGEAIADLLKSYGSQPC